MAFLGADSRERLRDCHFTEFLHPDDREASGDRFRTLMSEDDDAPERRFRVRMVDGEIREATVATVP